jgi:hypothetical protein
MNEKRIVTDHVFPPVPSRSFDWCAYYEGEEEKQNYGWGRTEEEAVADLLADTGEKQP